MFTLFNHTHVFFCFFSVKYMLTLFCENYSKNDFRHESCELTNAMKTVQIMSPHPIVVTEFWAFNWMRCTAWARMKNFGIAQCNQICTADGLTCCFRSPIVHLGLWSERDLLLNYCWSNLSAVVGKEKYKGPCLCVALTTSTNLASANWRATSGIRRTVQLHFFTALVSKDW